MAISQRLVSLGLFTGLLISIPSQGLTVQLADGSTAFAGVPVLVKAVTTNSDVYAWNATYYFTIAVPENASEPLHKLVIAQTEGLDRDLEFNLKRSYAFEGTSYRQKNQPKAIADFTFDTKKEEATIIFTPPIAPGKTITVGLEPYRNPTTSGVYLFGVTAYPPGAKPQGQFLGFGRLTFYREDLGWWR